MVNPDTTCVRCKKGFIYSDPGFFEFDDGTDSPKFGLCRECFHFIADNMGFWLSRYRKKIQKSIIIIEYLKATISRKLRQKVWERDKYSCAICGSKENLTVDHIYPECRGGTLRLGNLQTLCRSCNSKKGAKV